MSESPVRHSETLVGAVDSKVGHSARQLRHSEFSVEYSDNSVGVSEALVRHSETLVGYSAGSVGHSADNFGIFAAYRVSIGGQHFPSENHTYGKHICICPLFIFIDEWSNAKELACRQIGERNFQKCPHARQKRQTKKSLGRQLLHHSPPADTDDKTAQVVTAASCKRG